LNSIKTIGHRTRPEDPQTALERAEFEIDYQGNQVAPSLVKLIYRHE